MIKKIAVVSLLTLALVGCGERQEEEVVPEGHVEYIEIKTPSGKVPCVGWNSRRSVALSCDWSKEGE